MEYEIIYALGMVAIVLAIFFYLVFFHTEQKCPKCSWYDYSFFKRKTCPQCGAKYKETKKE